MISLALISLFILAGNLFLKESDSTGNEAQTAEVRPARIHSVPMFRLKRDKATIQARLRQAKARQAAKRERRQQTRQRFATLPDGVSRSTLEAIASCESGGDPRIVSSDGSYHGKYQFSLGTWNAVGGHGLPERSSEAEQDYRAALLYARSGPGQWPVCG